MFKENQVLSFGKIFVLNQNISTDFSLFFSVVSILFHQSVIADFDAVNIAFYYGSNVSEYEIFSISSIDNVTTHKAFYNSRKTVLYIHGFRENLTSESVVTIVEAFIKRKTHNILVLNWSAYANGSYVKDAVPNLIKVERKPLRCGKKIKKVSLQIGKLVGRSVYSLINQKNFELNKLHGEKVLLAILYLIVLFHSKSCRSLTRSATFRICWKVGHCSVKKHHEAQTNHGLRSSKTFVLP